MIGSSVLLVTDEARTVSEVTAVLGNGDRPAGLVVCHDLSELVLNLQRLSPPAAIVDVGNKGLAMLADLEPIITRYAQTRFIVLSSSYGPELVIEGMKVGARYVMSKSAIAADLASVMHRVVPPESGPSKHGQLVTVLSAGGGCGATTLAVNLAHELSLVSNAPALLVDMDLNYGAAATYLGLESQFGLVNVLSRSNIDAELLRSSASVYGQHLHVLVSPASSHPGELSMLDDNRVPPALAMCRQVYDWTVIDAPRLPAAVTGKLALASKLTMLVMQLTVKDVRTAKSTLAVLRQHGVWPEMVTPVANRYVKRSRLVTLEEAQAALGVNIRTFSNDFASTVKSVNFGQPLTVAAPRSPLRRELQQLAMELTSDKSAKAKQP